MDPDPKLSGCKGYFEIINLTPHEVRDRKGRPIGCVGFDMNIIIPLKGG